VAGGNRIAWPFGPSLLPPTPHLLSLQRDSNVFSTKTRKEKDKKERKEERNKTKKNMPPPPPSEKTV
jgi:hypothetical protein